MGCLSSKVKKSVGVKDLRLENVGVASIDAFNNQVEVIVNGCADVEEKIGEARRYLEYVAGFDVW